MANNTDGTEVLLFGDFSMHHSSKKRYRIELTNHGISFFELDKNAHGNKVNVHKDDILGCDCLKGRKKNDTAAYLSFYCYQHKKKVIGDSTLRQRRVLTIVFNAKSSYEDNSSDCLVWKSKVIHILRNPWLLHSSGPDVQSKKWLFLVNPKSGPGKALTIFQQRVIPMLAESGIEFKLVVTTHAGHGEEMMTSLKLEEWYCVVIISGDGLLYEVINGLMKRSDWKKAIKFPVGTVPGGSGNALACALSHSAKEPYLDSQVLHSTYLLIKHQQLAMDLVALETASGKKLYSFLSVSWGLISDVDIESEKFRALGNFRFTLGGLIRIAGLRKYRGRVSFLPCDKYTPQLANPKLLNRSQSDYPHADGGAKITSIKRRAQSMVAEGQGQDAPTYAQEGAGDGPSTKDMEDDQSDDLIRPQFSLDNGDEAAVGKQSKGVENENEANEGRVENVSESNSGPELSLLVPLSEPVPDNWVTIDDEFISVVAVSMSHLGPDLIVDSNIKLNDGAIYLLMVHRNVNRSQLLKMMLALADGTAEYTNGIEMVKVRAFRIEPLSEKGILAVDGEVVDYGAIQGQILPGMANIMGIDRS